MRNPALFLDRDGVINVDQGYVHRIEDFKFIPGIFSLVRTANESRYPVVVVTNQAGIGRGYYTDDQFCALTHWMFDRFREEEAHIDALYFCPFHPVYGVGLYKKDSEFRKPHPGMMLRAAEDLRLDLSASIMVGDKLSDIDAAISAGIQTRFLFGECDESVRATHSENLKDIEIYIRKRTNDKSISIIRG